MKNLNLVLLLLFFSCDGEYDLADRYEEVQPEKFFSKEIDSKAIKPLKLTFCRKCETMEEAIAYELSIGSKELEISNKMKYEWNDRSISVTFPEERYDDLPLYVRFISFRIFIRKEEPFEDYTLAMIYFQAPMSVEVEVTKAFIYPGDNFFGFIKEEGGQFYRNLEFPKIPEISPSQLMRNYIAVLKWMESYSNSEFSLKGRTLDNGPFSSDIYLDETNVVYENQCVEDMLFYMILLMTSRDDLYEPIDFLVRPHAPFRAYYNHLPDDIYKSYYQFDTEDVAFEIYLRNEYFSSLSPQN
ncbi:MAG: hypothetical protein AAGC47_10370 [Bacteroidota bacterium]